MTDDTKNLILAIVLSMLVVIGWNYFFGMPALERLREEKHPTTTNLPVNQVAQAANPQNPQTPQKDTAEAVTDVDAISAVSGIPLTREQALAKSPRLAIDTPALSGSINLRGGVIDDLTLKAYRETVDPNSDHIVLLAPQRSPAPYYASFGWLSSTEGAASALNLPGPDSIWKADGEKLTATSPVTLVYDSGKGLVFRRHIHVDGHYMFTVEDKVENKGADAVTLFAYGALVRIGHPKLLGFSIIHEGMTGIIGDERQVQITYDQIEKEPRQSKTVSGTGGWLGFVDKYWGVTLIPDPGQKLDARFSASGPSMPRIYRADMIQSALSLPSGGEISTTQHLFAGAKETDLIDSYQNSLGIKNFDLMIDWGWFYFITKPLFALIDYLYKLTGNFGIAILIITVVLKALFFPLANASYRSMAQMKAIQPKIEELKARYGSDRQKMQEEQMALFKREKVNPAAGCLPVLLQIPVFFALYKVIFITIEMRQAPFFGWIQDLSAPDPTNLFTLFGLIAWDPTSLPFIGHLLALGIWPLIMGFSMFLQMKMNPEPTDPSQKMMFSWMPVIFTFMLGAFPSGLVIYWTWNNLISITQQYIIMRQYGVKVELWDNLAKMVKRA